MTISHLIENMKTIEHQHCYGGLFLESLEALKYTRRPSDFCHFLLKKNIYIYIYIIKNFFFIFFFFFL